MLSVLLTSGAAVLARDWSPEVEKKVGQDAVASIKKDFKLWDNPEQQARVLGVVKDLKVNTQRPEVDYQILLLDTDEVNAFSLPGGYICVTKGLLQQAESEAELAGVLAHEMAHNCTFDALNESARAQQLTLPIFAAVVAAMVTGRSGADIQKTYMAGMYVAYGVLSTYSIEVEDRADRNGVAYVLATKKYNPVGLLTFMERLAADERTRPKVTLGIFQTHPYSVDRAERLADLIRAAGVEVNRRAVTKWDPPKLAAGKLGEKDVQTLSLWGQQVFSFNWAPEGADLPGRGLSLVNTLTELLAAGLTEWELYPEVSGGNAAVKARGRTLVQIYPQDASLLGLEPRDAADQVIANLDKALFSERLNRLY